ncbi:hypothetical protein PsorP6_016368 [Peronosclerospora sorghi]|uniref:Uncharacterized protein n=1 Tax=Peronosclerospora sorghi TaxID=230839 RepID=A0ACC0VIA7_9STRA|nr:hypothetical protein PsorP6_016368 [Peronosclerospora sorghi]
MKPVAKDFQLGASLFNLSSCSQDPFDMNKRIAFILLALLSTHALLVASVGNTPKLTRSAMKDGLQPGMRNLRAHDGAKGDADEERTWKMLSKLISKTAQVHPARATSEDLSPIHEALYAGGVSAERLRKVLQHDSFSIDQVNQAIKEYKQFLNEKKAF